MKIKIKKHRNGFSVLIFLGKKVYAIEFNTLDRNRFNYILKR